MISRKFFADGAGRLGVREAALERSGRKQQTLLDEPEPRWVEVDASAVRVENCRAFDGPWLALELIKCLGLDEFLKEKLGDLFELEYDLLLYDVTSTYFEGEAKANPLAQGGDSRDKRGDCKQVCIGLVVSRWREGNVHPLSQPRSPREREGDAQTVRKANRAGAGEDAGRLSETEVQTVDDCQTGGQTAGENSRAAFRIHKSDLSIRPIWHQKEDRVLAHILVCFLAYVLWKTLGQLCRQSGLGDEPRRALEELKELRVVDGVLPTRPLQGKNLRQQLGKSSEDGCIGSLDLQSER